MGQTTELEAREARLKAIASTHLEHLRFLISNIENRANALQSFIRDDGPTPSSAEPAPSLAEPAPLPGEPVQIQALLARRELQLMVLMSRYLALAQPVYGSMGRRADRYLRRHQINDRWLENNHLFVDLLAEYAEAEVQLKDTPREPGPPVASPPGITAPAAAELAALVHAGMLYGDKPYTVHTDATAGIVREYFPYSDVLISAAHLHDAIEDAADSASADAIAQQILLRCGDEVHDLVVALTDEPGKSRAERKAKTLPKISRTGWRAVVVKVADRIANVSAASAYHLRMYVEEYHSFRVTLRAVGLGVEPLQRMWARLDALMVAAGAYVDPCDQPLWPELDPSMVDALDVTIHPDCVRSP
jgi:hypothetical protein